MDEEIASATIACFFLKNTSISKRKSIGVERWNFIAYFLISLDRFPFQIGTVRFHGILLFRLFRLVLLNESENVKDE